MTMDLQASGSSSSHTPARPGYMSAIQSGGAMLLKRCMSFLLPFWRLEILGFLVTAAAASLSVAQPWFQKLLIDGVVVGGSLQLLERIILLLIGAVAARITLSFAAKVLFTNIREHATRNLRTSMGERLAHLALPDVNAKNPGDIVSTLLQDVEVVGALYGELFIEFLTDFLVLGAVITVMAFIDIWLAVMTLGAMAILALSFRNLTRPVEKVTLAVQESTASASVAIGEFWRAIPEVRLLNCYDLSRKSLLDSFERLRKARFRRNLVQNLIATNEFTIWIVTAGMVWYAGARVIAGQMTMGDLVAFWGYMGIALGPINDFLTIGSTVRSSMAGAKRIFRLVDEGSFENPDAGLMLPSSAGSIEFRSVDFSHDTTTVVLARSSFKVREGEWIGIVGASGCGKSTAAALMAALLHPDSGEIRLGDLRLSELSPRALRQHLGVATQNPHIFIASAFDNIAVARMGATLEEVVQSAKKARVHDQILSLPDGYETALGEGVRQLSGGERQRFSLARIFLKNPRIIILDEATSAIDQETADAIEEELAATFSGRTCFVISHHPRALKNVDRVLSLADGSFREICLEEACAMVASE